jgi:hypothetical protein
MVLPRNLRMWTWHRIYGAVFCSGAAASLPSNSSQANRPSSRRCGHRRYSRQDAGGTALANWADLLCRHVKDSKSQIANHKSPIQNPKWGPPQRKMLPSRFYRDRFRAALHSTQSRPGELRRIHVAVFDDENAGEFGFPGLIGGGDVLAGVGFDGGDAGIPGGSVGAPWGRVSRLLWLRRIDKESAGFTWHNSEGRRTSSPPRHEERGSGLRLSVQTPAHFRCTGR